MKRRGASILMVDGENRVLLFLRDDIPGLPYANMWDVPGGHVEAGETPSECIVREMKEEIGIDLENFRLFREYEFEDRIESVFLSFCSYSTDDLTLTEGQALKWFSEKEAEETELAYGFNRVVSDYYMCLSENKGRNGVSR